MKEKTDRNEGETGLEKIQEQEESEVEYSKHLSIHQEKFSPLQMISDQPIDEYQVVEEEKPKNNGDVEEEVIFINVYPERKKDEDILQKNLPEIEYTPIKKEEREIDVVNSQESLKKEKTKKAGLTSSIEKSNNIHSNEQKQMKIDEDLAKHVHDKMVRNSPPKAPFLKTPEEMREINEEENQKFRYSKMDEKTAEILYQERFFNKFIVNK